MADRVRITLVCSQCGARNYPSSRSKKVGSKPLELKKYCPHCNSHTMHAESK